MYYQSNMGEHASQEISANHEENWPFHEEYSSLYEDPIYRHNYQQMGQPMHNQQNMGTPPYMNNNMHQQPMHGQHMYTPYGPQQPQMHGGQMPGQMVHPQAQQQPSTPGGMLPMEQSFIENILRFNQGKRARFYMTFENNPEWPARVFTGVIEEAGRDHIIVRSPEEGQNYLLLMVNLDYVEFEEEIDYVSPQVPGMATGSPQR